MTAPGELPADLVAAVGELTELKSRTREMGSGPAPVAIARFIGRLKRPPETRKAPHHNGAEPYQVR
ncbi:hypothetical protein [Nocardia coffeae]|uniref:hypothetical protein n=1 Tax=Nocardia coffeae TaxID=2873381 RepID=UPI001F1AFD58|nr:hypothetical protein [Nocardia coffeae]